MDEPASSLAFKLSLWRPRAGPLCISDLRRGVKCADGASIGDSSRASTRLSMLTFFNRSAWNFVQVVADAMNPYLDKPPKSGSMVSMVQPNQCIIGSQGDVGEPGRR